MATSVETHLLTDDGLIPNNPRCPLLLYPGAVPAAVSATDADPAAVIERLFADHGWGDSWRDGVYPYHHYHSTAHEVLGCYRGEATVQFGGDGGVTRSIAAGDVVVIPVGIGHKRLRASPDFAVVGAYSDGQRPDLNYGKPEERSLALANIARVPLPTRDPVFGSDGPLARLWGGKESA